MMGKPKKPENKAPDVIGVRGWIATDKGPLAGVVREVVRGGWYCFEPDDMFGGGHVYKRRLKNINFQSGV
jgi:hypothetical protein